jgi:methylenetetrahydrofolate reductase (NADPH)
MKLNEIWRGKGKPSVSFELYPARNEKDAASLQTVIDELATLGPDFVSVTFGAGGSTRDASRGLVEKLKREKRLEVLAYFAGFGLGPEQIDAVLQDYKTLGVENVFVIRGDVPREQSEFERHPQSMAHATELIQYIKPRFDFCLGAAGYPEGHIEAESRERDWDYLKMKVDCGAQFIIAQFIYDTRYFFSFLEGCRARGIHVPIIPGVMPVFSVKIMENLARLCGATVTDELKRGLGVLPEGDKNAVVQFGIDFAARQCSELLREGVPGIHFYTMDRAKSVVEIVKRLRAEALL